MYQRFLKLVLLSFISFPILAQGPIDGYMKKSGETDFALSFGSERFTKYYLGEQLLDTFDRQYNSLSLFIAHGFEDNLNLIVSLPYMWTDENNRGLQDAQFLLKFAPLAKTFDGGSYNMITAAGVTTPLSKYPISPDSSNPIGERATSLEGRIGFQYNNWNNGLFAFVKTGVTYRLSPQKRTAIPSLIRFGFATSKIYVDAWLEGVFTLNADPNELVLGGGGSTYAKTGGVFYYSLSPNFGAFLGGAYTFWGKNIGLAPRYSFGIVYKFMGQKATTVLFDNK